MISLPRLLLSAAVLATPVLAQANSQPCEYGYNAICIAQNDPVTTFTPRSLPNEYAHAVLAPSAATVGGFSFYFQTVAGGDATIQAAFYREDPANAGQPDPNPVASGTILVGGALGWYTCVLDAPVAVAAGELFFISADTNAVRPPDDGSGATPPAPSFWRRPPFGGTSWSQTGIINSPIYRVHCTGPRGVVNHLTNLPQINNQLDLNVAGAEAGLPNFAIFGTSSNPLDLTPIGAPGSLVLTTPVVLSPPFLPNQNGDGTFSFNMPNDMALVGSQVRTQVLSGTTDNSLGFKTSNVVKLTIG